MVYKIVRSTDTVSRDRVWRVQTASAVEAAHGAGKPVKCLHAPSSGILMYQRIMVVL